MAMARESVQRPNRGSPWEFGIASARIRPTPSSASTARPSDGSECRNASSDAKERTPPRSASCGAPRGGQERATPVAKMRLRLSLRHGSFDPRRRPASRTRKPRCGVVVPRHAPQRGKIGRDLGREPSPGQGDSSVSCPTQPNVHLRLTRLLFAAPVDAPGVPARATWKMGRPRRKGHGPFDPGAGSDPPAALRGAPPRGAARDRRAGPALP